MSNRIFYEYDDGGSGGLDMGKTASQWMNKCISSLYLFLPEEVANDVSKRWEAAKSEFSEQLLEKDKEIERLNKAIETIYLPIGEQQDQRIKELEDGLRELVKWHEPDGRWNYTAAVEKAQQLLSSSQSTQ